MKNLLLKTLSHSINKKRVLLNLIFISILVLFINIETNAQCSINAGNDKTIAFGSSTKIVSTPSGGSNYTYLWSNGEKTKEIIVAPTITTTYCVTLTSGTCTASDCVVITSYTCLSVNAGADQTIKSGASASLSATAIAAVV